MPKPYTKLKTKYQIHRNKIHRGLFVIFSFFISILVLISLILIQTVFFGAGSTQAAGIIINAASCQQTDILSAYNSANAGDTIDIPKGECVWNTTLTLDKSITLKGAGADFTKVIYGGSSPLVNISLPSDQPVRITGLYFDFPDNFHPGGNGNHAIQVSGGKNEAYGLTKIRIDHNTFNKGARQIFFTHWAYGLIDNNNFINGNISIGLMGDDNYSWNRPIIPGTADAVFIEDNTFTIDNNTDTEPNELIYLQEGARSIVRYNTFDGRAYTNGYSLFFDSHGNQNYYRGSNDFRGQPIIEVYNNKMYAYKTYRHFYFRGGSILLYDNTMRTEIGSDPKIQLSEEESWQTVFFNPLNTTWNAEDQIMNSFFWNNTSNGNPITDVELNHQASDSIFIQKDRDYFMRAPSDAGGKASYVDRPGGNEIFSASGASTYYPYIPYPYPHPLIIQKDQIKNFFYVRSEAAGNNDGTDWNNAYTKLPATLVRGATYYVAGGNYPSYSFDDPVSGEESIVIKKATLTDHGTDVGWDSRLGDGVAEFRSFVFESNYYIIDGVTGGGPESWETGFGFKIHGEARNVTLNNGASHISLKHIDMENLGRDTHNSNANVIYAISGSRNITVSYSYLHDVAVCHLLTRSSDGFVVEYNKLARNGASGDSLHREAWSASTDGNVVIRYNIFEDISNTAFIGLVNGNGDAENWQIYGNVFVHTPAVTDAQVSALIEVKYASPTFVRAVNWKIYNNTIINVRGLHAGIKFGNGSGNQVYNNIWYGTRVNSIGIENATHDYNYFFDNRRLQGCSPPCDLDTPMVSSETHAQLGTVDPFIDWQNDDFHLKKSIPGIVLPSPFDKDVAGSIRGQDGVWDIGAYEYEEGTPADTTPPILSLGAPSGNLLAGTTQTTLSLKTNENATCKYGTVAGIAYASIAPPAGGTFTITGGTSHSQAITNLTNGTTYNYYLRCKDTLNNQNTTDYLITFSVNTPQIKSSDLNQDTKVDSLDFEILKLDYNKTTKPKSDINQDGIVNTQDIGIMMGEWG